MENRVKDIKLAKIPQMDVGRITELLADSYSVLINNKKPIKIMPSVMLWGPPGVGKSQAVRQIAKEIEERTGKKSVVTDVRLLLFNPIDLRGIPTSNADKTLAIWLKPQIFQMDSSDDIVNILFLDEISAAPQSVQAAAYQITLDRVVGEHKLPDNCNVYNQLPDMDDIFNGLRPRVPKSPDVLYALTAAMTSYAREHKEEITKIANSIRYAEKLPPDFGVVLMKDYMYIEKDYKRKLMAIPDFAKWLSAKGKILNGVIK